MSAQRFEALVVDDDAISRKAVGFNLEQEGFHCEYCNGAADALKVLESQTFDLVVTDLCMPNGHGHSLAVKILSRLDRPLVIAHSGIEDPRMTRELISRGVDDVIYKPANYAGFAAKVSVWAARRRAASNRAAESCPRVDETGLPDCKPASSEAVDLFFSATSDAAIADIAESVKQNPALSESILALANLPNRNNTGKRITDLTLALRHVGMKKFADMALDQLRTNSLAIE